jgi:S-adenosylmethionine:diacylglycerol 3-amino-3-carboxypropyl transferase
MSSQIALIPPQSQSLDKNHQSLDEKLKALGIDEQVINTQSTSQKQILYSRTLYKRLYERLKQQQEPTLQSHYENQCRKEVAFVQQMLRLETQEPARRYPKRNIPRVDYTGMC